MEKTTRATGVAMSSKSPSWIRPRAWPENASVTIPRTWRRFEGSPRKILYCGGSPPWRTRNTTAPIATTAAAMITPMRSRLPTICSIRKSLQGRAISEPPGEAVVDHLHRKDEDDERKDPAENVGAGVDQHPRPQHRTRQDPEHDRHGEGGVDVAAAQVDAGAGGGGDADHEVGGGGGDLERDVHGVVHRQHLDRPRADSEQPRKRAGHRHQAEAGRHTLDVVGPLAAQAGEAAVEAQPHREAVRLGRERDLVVGPTGKERGVEQHDAEHDRDHRGGEAGRQGGAQQRAERRRDFQEHADPDIREPLLDERRGGPRRGGYDGHEGGSDGVPDVDTERKGEKGHDDDAAAETGQRTEKARHQRTGPHQQREDEVVQEPLLSLARPSRGSRPLRHTGPTRPASYRRPRLTAAAAARPAAVPPPRAATGVTSPGPGTAPPP